ncbi:MAG: universal stress protein [Halorientalis sp.]
MTHVLVPIDESPLSTQALEHALESHPDADVTVIHVIDFVEAGYQAPVGGTIPGHWEDWYESQEDEAEALFDEARETAAEHDADVETELFLGRPDRSIVSYAEDEDVDHIVMGSHGRTGVKRILVGSVAEKVVRRAPCPVTVVR